MGTTNKVTPLNICRVRLQDCASRYWSLVSAKFCALRWSTLGKWDRPGFSLERKLCHCRSLHLCHFRCCSFAWKTRKPNGFVISFPSPFCVYIWNSSWQIVKTGTSSRTRGRIGQTRWRRKCTQRNTNFEASWSFPGLSYILIATAKKKMVTWNVNDISCARDWTQVCYIFPA